MRPLLLTGPPAVGKTTTSRALAMARPRCAVIDVDDIRQLVVTGHAAPWDGDEGRLQQHIGVQSACDLAERWWSAGIDVILADVVDADTLHIYRRRLPDLMVITLRLSLAEARRRAATRPVHLTDQEFDQLHVAAQRDDLAGDARLEVGELTLEQQTAAVLAAWSLS